MGAIGTNWLGRIENLPDDQRWSCGPRVGSISLARNTCWGCGQSSAYRKQAWLLDLPIYSLVQETFPGSRLYSQHWQRHVDHWVQDQPGLLTELQYSWGYTKKPCLKPPPSPKERKKISKKERSKERNHYSCHLRTWVCPEKGNCEKERLSS